MSTVFFSFLYIVILTFRAARLAEYGCEPGWHYEPANGFCYLFVKDLWMTWISARAYCLELGADLTSIHSEEENDLVFDLIEGQGFAWIGITDAENEGVFPTFTDGTLVDYENWAVDSYDHHLNRDCAFMKHDDNKVWFWQTCSITQIRCVCKKPHAIITTPVPHTTVLPVLPSIHILCTSPVFESKEAWCAFLMDTVVEHSNYTFCFGDSEDACSVAKPKSWSLDDMPDALKDAAPSMNGYLVSFHNYIYTAVGSYNVTAFLNQTLVAEMNLTVVLSCISSLSIHMQRQCRIPYPDEYLKALDIHVSAFIELEGKFIDPVTSDFKWWIYTSTDDGNVTTAFEKITHVPHLTIGWGTLAYGNYSLKLTAEMHHKISNELTGIEEITTSMEIQPSSLVAVIKGGSSLSHGLSLNLVVDGSSSYDPDVIQGSASDLTFYWYCVLVHSDITYISLEETLQNADEPCVEDEGILMDSTSSKLEIPANNLRADLIMNFWLLVSKEGRIFGSTQQRIHLNPGLLPQIEISCISNCNKYIISPERLVLLASCANCDGENEGISYQWSLMTNTSLIDDISSQTTTGLDQPFLVIKPHTFDTIPATDDVIIRVTGYMPDSGSFGFAEFMVKINDSPFGCCLITPTEGYALQTDFAVSCYGFIDDESPLTYELVQFSSVHLVDGNLVGYGEGLEFYEGREQYKGEFSLPVGDNNHTVLVQVNVRDCYMATTSVLLSATVKPPDLGENVTQELLSMKSSVDSRVNGLLAVGEIGQATSLISALGSILNSIGDENDTKDEGRETRQEIRSSLIDSVASIPIESMEALKQSLAALVVLTHNKYEMSLELQMKALSVLDGLTSFLDAEHSSYSQDQNSIESASTMMVIGLSNILSTAEHAERLLSTDTSQDSEEYKILTELVLAVINEVQDAVVHGKIPGAEATVLTSPTLSIAVSSISTDKLPGATFEGPDDADGLGSYTMPYDGLEDVMVSVIGIAVNIQMMAVRWWWGAGGESFNSSILGIHLRADHNTLQVQDLSHDISVYLPMKEPVSRESLSAHISKNSSAFLDIEHSSLPEYGAVHLRVLSENEPFVFLSICAANISENQTVDCSEAPTVVNITAENFHTSNFTWTSTVAEFKAGILISLYNGSDQPVYENENISLAVFIYTSECRFWNEDQREWGSTGCKVGPFSNSITTQCLCNRLTFFGSSLLVPPARIYSFTEYIELPPTDEPSCCKPSSLYFSWMLLLQCCVVYFCW